MADEDITSSCVHVTAIQLRRSCAAYMLHIPDLDWRVHDRTPHTARTEDAGETEMSILIAILMKMNLMREISGYQPEDHYNDVMNVIRSTRDERRARGNKRAVRRAPPRAVSGEGRRVCPRVVENNGTRGHRRSEKTSTRIYAKSRTLSPTLVLLGTQAENPKNNINKCVSRCADERHRESRRQPPHLSDATQGVAAGSAFGDSRQREIEHTVQRQVQVQQHVTLAYCSKPLLTLSIVQRDYCC